MIVRWFILGSTLLWLGCGNSGEGPQSSTSHGSGTGGEGGQTSRAGGGDSKAAVGCKVSVAGDEMELTISNVSADANVDTRFFRGGSVQGSYGSGFCVKGCTDIQGICALKVSSADICANPWISIARKPIAGTTYTIIPTIIAHDEDGTPGLATGGGYVLLWEAVCGQSPRWAWIATAGTLRIDDVAGATVKFSFTDLTMEPYEMVKNLAMGTFKMSGSGTVKMVKGL